MPGRHSVPSAAGTHVRSVSQACPLTDSFQETTEQAADRMRSRPPHPASRHGEKGFGGARGCKQMRHRLSDAALPVAPSCPVSLSIT